MFKSIARTAILAAMMAGPVYAADRATPSPAAIQAQPKLIPAPKGSMPEGIAIRGSTAFLSSLTDGSVHRLNLDSGEASVLHAGEHSISVGLLVDDKGRLFVARGKTGIIDVLDTESGERLARYQVAGAGNHFVNDFTQLGKAIYATDSFSPVLYRLPLGEDGALPPANGFETIALSGIDYGEGFNANGISQTPDGSALLVVQTNTGKLFRVDAASGAASAVDTGGTSLKFGDGMLREGNTLYVVQNRSNTVAVLEVDDAGRSARLKTELKHPAFDTPTTIARGGDTLYLPNPRFGREDAAQAEYFVTGIPYRP